MANKFKYIYGPVPSWRLGSSLGVDILSQDIKVCNFNCVYCQLGETPTCTNERRLYVSAGEIVKELEVLSVIKPNYITLAGKGEPTLAYNLGQLVTILKNIRKEPIAVLTNSSLLDRKDIRTELIFADFIVAKLDAHSQESLERINRPARELNFDNILKGIKTFRMMYQGKFALQMMFVDKNMNTADELIRLTNYIKPDEVQINTPTRSSPITPLSEEEIFKITDMFSSACKNVKIVSVYDERSPKIVASISDEDTLRRRGKIKH